jgi:hypothetical protein
MTSIPLLFEILLVAWLLGSLCYVVICAIEVRYLHRHNRELRTRLDAFFEDPSDPWRDFNARR